MSIVNWLVLALCLLLAFLLSGMEAGVFALSRLRVRRLARARQAVGKTAARLSRKAGEFSVDHSRRQHARQFFDTGLDAARVARMAFGP
jgi:hypothetical protein